MKTGTIFKLYLIESCAGKVVVSAPLPKNLLYLLHLLFDLSLTIEKLFLYIL